MSEKTQEGEDKMFSNAKVGDRVWDIRKGWGTVECTDFGPDYSLRVEFDEFDDGGDETFTIDGKYLFHDKNPTLFWDEVKFDVPEKPEYKEGYVGFFVNNHGRVLIDGHGIKPFIYDTEEEYWKKNKDSYSTFLPPVKIRWKVRK